MNLFVFISPTGMTYRKGAVSIRKEETGSRRRR
jgi:hypothetical protein